MGSTLEALQRLQTVELQLAEIRRERGAKQRRIDYHKRHIKKVEERLEEGRAIILERQVRLDALQLDVTAREESIDHHRQALNKAKTNKEYAAILTAMNTEKADNSKLENEVLRLMEATQTLKDEAAKIDAEKAKLDEDLARAEGVLCKYDDESRARHNKLMASREECADEVPPTALQAFDRVAQHHDGEALAPVLKLHPKRDDYACSGCNMKVTLEMINVLHTRDDIQICRVCGRILHLDTEDAKR